MIGYIARRLLQAVPVLFLSSVGVFLFIHIVPGDPAVTMAGQNATPVQVAALRHRFGLDQPLITQYARWVGHVFRGDLGIAYVTPRPISSLIAQRVPATLHLAAGTMIVMVVVGGPLGVFSAVRPHHPLSRLVVVANALALATPTFWLGILLILVFAVFLHWLPPSGYVSFTENPVQSIRSLILPSLTLGAWATTILIRFLRASISESIGAEFVRVAYAKGLPERDVVCRHVLKIALLPVVTIMAVQFGYLLGGAVITEAIFGWPGLGRLMVDAIGSQDYFVVQGTMLLFVTTFIMINVLADVAYAFLNPRIRYSR
jgi:peptide/nickel transport system permease protein